MNKTDNMKQAMHEMFGIGKGTQKEAPTVKSNNNNNKNNYAKPLQPPTISAPNVPSSLKKTPEYATSILAEGSSFEGTFNAKGDVEICGEFKGNLTAEGAVRLRSSIQSSISAKSVDLQDCVLNGDINAKSMVSISENSKVVGNVQAKDLVCAGEIVGDLKISESVRLDAKAHVSGSIVTGAISVEKGAVISGNVQIRAFSEAKA